MNQSVSEYKGEWKEANDNNSADKAFFVLGDQATL
jgi:hypothetical protein